VQGAGWRLQWLQQQQQQLRQILLNAQLGVRQLELCLNMHVCLFNRLLLPQQLALATACSAFQSKQSPKASDQTL
jgi:hypothetical protein